MIAPPPDSSSEEAGYLLLLHAQAYKYLGQNLPRSAYNSGNKLPTQQQHLALRQPNTAIMQAMPDSRQQSFEEIYGPPENFLEIEVSCG